MILKTDSSISVSRINEPTLDYRHHVLKFISFPFWQPQRLIRHKIVRTITVMAEEPKPLVTLDPEKPDAPYTLLFLVNLSADNTLKKGQRLKLHGLIVDSAYGFWHVWSKSLEFAKK